MPTSNREVRKISIIGQDLKYRAVLIFWPDTNTADYNQNNTQH